MKSFKQYLDESVEMHYLQRRCLEAVPNAKSILDATPDELRVLKKVEMDPVFRNRVAFHPGGFTLEPTHPNDPELHDQIGTWVVTLYGIEGGKIMKFVAQSVIDGRKKKLSDLSFQSKGFYEVPVGDP